MFLARVSNGGFEGFFQIVVQPAVLFFGHQFIPHDSDEESLLFPWPHLGDHAVEFFLLLHSIGIQEGK